jgi:hypothetical protein
MTANEAESITFEQCAAGAKVLLDAVLEYDRASHRGCLTMPVSAPICYGA